MKGGMLCIWPESGSDTWSQAFLQIDSNLWKQEQPDQYADTTSPTKNQQHVKSSSIGRSASPDIPQTWDQILKDLRQYHDSWAQLRFSSVLLEPT